MKALTDARYLGQEGAWFRFGLAHGFEARIAILEADIARVVFRREGGYRLDRAGRLRRMAWSHLSRAACARISRASPARRRLLARGRHNRSHRRFSLTVKLSPFGLTWRRKGEDTPSFRSPHASLSRPRGNRRDQPFRAREKADRHYGLGDKTGRLDKTGTFSHRCSGPLWLRCRNERPALQDDPVLHRGWPGGPHGLFYDNLATASVDFGATLDNYHGLFRSYQADDGDLDFYVFAGQRSRMSRSASHGSRGQPSRRLVAGSA